MEIMSKAFLIAGAIIIAIGVIASGVYIASRGQEGLEEIENVNVDKAKRTAQVSKFSKYEGQVIGTEVKQCIYEAIAYNAGLSKNGDYSENLPYAIGVHIDFLSGGGANMVNKNNYNNNGGRVSYNFAGRMSDIPDSQIYNCTLVFDNHTGTLRELRFEV